MTKRSFKPRRRKSNVRDARLIVIATEGAKTEKQYFEEMVSPAYYHNAKIHVVILSKESSYSSPGYVIETLDKFKREFTLQKDDELWMVIDVDRWGDKKLSDIATQCLQKNYHLAVSNPSFELWLLLHHTSLEAYDQTVLAEFIENKKTGRKTRLERELSAILDGFNKNKLDVTQFLPYVTKAIANTKALDTNVNDRWPLGLGSRVYRLAEKIINK